MTYNKCKCGKDRSVLFSGTLTQDEIDKLPCSHCGLPLWQEEKDEDDMDKIGNILDLMVDRQISITEARQLIYKEIEKVCNKLKHFTDGNAAYEAGYNDAVYEVKQAIQKVLLGGKND